MLQFQAVMRVLSSKAFNLFKAFNLHSVVSLFSRVTLTVTLSVLVDKITHSLTDSMSAVASTRMADQNDKIVPVRMKKK